MVRVGSLVSLGICTRGDRICCADKCFTWVLHTLRVRGCSVGVFVHLIQRRMQRSCFQPRLWETWEDPGAVPQGQYRCTHPWCRCRGAPGFVPYCNPQLAALSLFPGNEYKYLPSREKLAGAVWRPVTFGRSRHPTLPRNGPQCAHV